MSLIDADELVQRMKLHLSFYKNPKCDKDKAAKLVITNCIEHVKHSRIIDAEPVKHAHWEPDYDYTESDWDGIPIEPRKFQDGWHCSDCGHYECDNSDPYCGGCGAKMDEEEREE